MCAWVLLLLVGVGVRVGSVILVGVGVRVGSVVLVGVGVRVGATILVGVEVRVGVDAGGGRLGAPGESAGVSYQVASDARLSAQIWHTTVAGQYPPRSRLGEATAVSPPLLSIAVGEEMAG